MKCVHSLFIIACCFLPLLHRPIAACECTASTGFTDGIGTDDIVARGTVVGISDHTTALRVPSKIAKVVITERYYGKVSVDTISITGGAGLDCIDRLEWIAIGKDYIFNLKVDPINQTWYLSECAARPLRIGNGRVHGLITSENGVTLDVADSLIRSVIAVASPALLSSTDSRVEAIDTGQGHKQRYRRLRVTGPSRSIQVWPVAVLFGGVVVGYEEMIAERYSVAYEAGIVIPERIRRFTAVLKLKKHISADSSNPLSSVTCGPTLCYRYGKALSIELEDGGKMDSYTYAIHHLVVGAELGRKWVLRNRLAIALSVGWGFRFGKTIYPNSVEREAGNDMLFHGMLGEFTVGYAF